MSSAIPKKERRRKKQKHTDDDKGKVTHYIDQALHHFQTKQLEPQLYILGYFFFYRTNRIFQIPQI